MLKNFLIIALLIIGSFFVAATAHAEMTTYEGIGEYRLMKGENHNFGKKRAKEIAERDVLEQIYFYIKIQSTVENSHLTKDEIIVIAAGMIYVVDKRFSMTVEDGSFLIKAIVIAEVDPDKVSEEVEKEKKRRLNTN